MATKSEIREDLELEKLKVEVSKLVEETRKTRKEADWYLLIIGSGVTLAIVAVAKLFL